MRTLSLFSALFLWLVSEHVPAQDLTPEEVIALVRTKGSQKTVNEIRSSQDQANQLLDGVRSAKPKWVEAAKSLALWADAGASEELNDAIAAAFLKSPYQLLPWLKKTWWKGNQTACFFGYDSELPGGVKIYATKLSNSLHKKAPKNLEFLRQECIYGLEKTQAEVKASPKWTRVQQPVNFQLRDLTSCLLTLRFTCVLKLA